MASHNLWIVSDFRCPLRTVMAISFGTISSLSHSVHQGNKFDRYNQSPDRDASDTATVSHFLDGTSSCDVLPSKDHER